MSELNIRGPSNSGDHAEAPAALGGPLGTPRGDLSDESASSYLARRGSSSSLRGSLVHSPASELLLHSQSSSLQGFLSNREAVGGGPAFSPHAISPSFASGDKSSTTTESAASPTEQVTEGEEQQQVLKQDIAFNALGQPLCSRTLSLSRGWKTGEAGGNTGIDIETNVGGSSNSSSGSSNTSTVWPSLDNEPASPPLLLPFGATITTSAATAAAATAGAPTSVGFREGADVQQPRTFSSAVRGGLERLMRLSNWPHRDAHGASSNGERGAPASSAEGPPALSLRKEAPPPTGNLPANSANGNFAQQPLGLYGQHLQQESPPFGVAHPEVRAHVVLLMELQRMRNELTQLHLQQQRQPSIVIQNHTAVAAKAEGASAPQQPERNNWLPPWISLFFSSRLNRLLFVCGVGVSCFMLLEHWRHSWRMAQLKRRMDANLLLRGFQILEETLGLRR